MSEKRCVKNVDSTKFLGDQLQVFQNILIDLKSKSISMGLIKGPAGYGKTYLVATIIEQLCFEGMYKKIGVLAPTGQAVKVCRDNAPYIDNKIRYGTIHSAFAMRPKRDSDKLIFVQDKTKKVWATDCQILFVDEVSQLEDELFYLLDDYVTQNSGIVIFLGDKFQIPPIGYKYSIPFSKNEAEKYGIKVYELTKPIRQMYGNPILDNADYIRSVINRPLIYVEREDSTNELGESVEFLEVGKYDVKALLSKYFLHPDYQNNPHYIKILAWRNATVAKWNGLVRKLLYSNEPENIKDTRSGEIKKIVIGERLLADNPIVERDEFTGEDKVLFGTNEELVVEGFSFDEYDVDGSGAYVIEYYDTVVTYFDENGLPASHSIRIVTEESEKVYQKVLEILAQNACRAKKGSMEAALCWKDYWEFKDMFAQVSYDYAKTVHKAQGSTYENTIVVEWDIMESPDVSERGRILYVACTRPKKHLIQIYKD